MQKDLVAGEESLRDLAERTGGRVLFPERGKDLSKAYDDVAEELRARYVLGFYEPESAKPGFHALVVGTRRPGVELRARAGYYHAFSADAAAAGR